MIPGDMYEWSGGIFAKKTKFHDAGGPGTVVSPMNNIVRSLSSLGQVTDNVCTEVCLYFGVSEPYLGTL